VGFERGPLSLVSRIEEILGRNSSGFGLENREYGCGDPLRWPRDTFYLQKLVTTSPTSGGRSVRMVRLRAKATEFVFCYGTNKKCAHICGEKVYLKLSLWESDCIDTRIIDIGTRWRWLVSFTPQPHYPGERASSTSWIGGWTTW
jgi:hypothetical protein